MAINITLPDAGPNLHPQITVMGIGGAGGNAVNNMISSNLEGVDFLIANTDAQALENASCENKIQLGLKSTRGLGAGMRPDVGRESAEECIEEIKAKLNGSHMVFIAAGMGGGTGTGAAPVIAKLARENGILTVGVITKPFHFEGTQRMKLAEGGIKDLQQHVDTLITIPNQNLFRIANEKTTFADAFKMADDVLYAGVRGVTDLMVQPGLINLDFSDIKTVMSEMGKAMMGTGQADGENRAIDAAEAAIANPLIDDVSLKGARGLIINITGGNDLTLYEVDEAANRIKQEIQDNANIIYGTTCDSRLEGIVRVSIVATGIDSDSSVKNNPIDQTAATLQINNSMYKQQQAYNSVNSEAIAIHSSMDDHANGELSNDEHLNIHEQQRLEESEINNKETEANDVVQGTQDSIFSEIKENQESTNLDKQGDDSNNSVTSEESGLTEEIVVNSDKSELNEVDKNETKVQETEETATVRKLSLFDPLSEESTGSTNIEKENMDHKAEPTLEEDNEHIHSEEEVPNSEFEPEESVSEEDLNQDKEEELLDIPTFLRRQAN